MNQRTDPSVALQRWELFRPFWLRALTWEIANEGQEPIDLERDVLGVLLLAEGTRAGEQRGAAAVHLIDGLGEIDSEEYPAGGFVLKDVKVTRHTGTIYIEAEAPYVQRLAHPAIAAALLWWRHRDDPPAGVRMPVAIGTFERPIVARGGGFMLGTMLGTFGVEVGFGQTRELDL